MNAPHEQYIIHLNCVFAYIFCYCIVMYVLYLVVMNDSLIF